MVCRTHLIFWMVYYWKDMERLHNMESYGYRKYIYLDEDWYSSMLAVHGNVMRHLWSWFNHVSTFPLVVWRGYPPYGTNSLYVMANGVPNSHAWVPEWRLCAAYVFSFPLLTGLNSIRRILSMFDYNNVFSYILVCWYISTMKSASRKSTGAAPTAPSTPDSTLVVRTTCRVAGWFNLGTKWINFKWRLTLEKPANGNYTAQIQTIHDFQGINIDKCCRELFGWPHYKIMSMFRSGKNTKT